MSFVTHVTLHALQNIEQKHILFQTIETLANVSLYRRPQPVPYINKNKNGVCLMTDIAFFRPYVQYATPSNTVHGIKIAGEIEKF